MNGTRKALSTIPLEERFWEKVDKSAGPDGCWLWTGRINDGGYGRIGLGRAIDGTAYAHRVSFSFTNGPVPEGMFVCHRCDNPPCVNPSHLFAGTPAENMRDASSKGRARGKASQGSDHPQAKLADADVYAIRARFAEPRVQVARAYGITPEAVSQIVLRRSWKHLPDLANGQAT